MIEVMPESHGETPLPPAEAQQTEASKERLAVSSEAQSRLRMSAYRALHFVSCEFHEGVLSLRGRVPSYYLKQVAQTLICQVEGVGQVNNRLEVAAPAASR